MANEAKRGDKVLYCPAWEHIQRKERIRMARIRRNGAFDLYLCERCWHTMSGCNDYDAIPL